MYNDVIPHAAREVHDGYFSADKRKGRIVALLDTSGGTAKDDETYELIMKDKERLLNTDEPLRFIFSHSALREGWDNPNVFQICTLREMGTDRERRQTIGRGLRLPVDRNGDRVNDDQVNRLTVIANESFENFARGLQAEIETAIDPNGGFTFGRITPLAFTPLLNASGSDYLSQDDLWNKIKQKTRYFVEFKTEVLIRLATQKIYLMAEIKEVRLEITKRDLEIKESGLEGGRITSNRTYIVNNDQPLPDILSFLQRETELTRGTLVEILKKSRRLQDFKINPAILMAEVAKCINRALHELIIDGIKYEPIAGQFYEMRLFEQQEVEEYLNRLYKSDGTFRFVLAQAGRMCHVA